MRPSGDTLDLVNPGMSRVVGRLREEVDVPEFCRRGGLEDNVRRVSLHFQQSTYMFGLLGAVVAGVSLRHARWSLLGFKGICEGQRPSSVGLRGGD